MPLRILATGDLHLGRRPSRIPPGEEALSVRAAWRRFVDEALRRQVDVVVLTGDTVDEANKVFEAIGALERGLRQLVEAGTEVVAVAGNHDWDAFPRLVQNLGEPDGLHVLGSGGRWSEHLVEKEGCPPVRFVGWSFPDRHVDRSPLESYDLDPFGGVTLGVLHADLDQPGSRYAPVTSEELAGRSEVAGWMLGHIHRSRLTDTDPWQLYVGSLQPLDPGEPGDHGAWLVEVDAQGARRPRPVSLASVRYAELEVDISSCEETAEVEAALFDAMRTRAATWAEEMVHLDHICFRLTVAGRTRLGADLEEHLHRLEEEVATGFAVDATVDRITLDVRPAYDLDELAAAGDARGELARLVLDLEDGGRSERARQVLREARAAARRIHDGTRYAPLRREHADELSDEALRRRLIQRAYLLLDELMPSEVHA